MLSRSVPACLMRAHVIEEQGSPAVAAPRDHARCLRTLWRWEAPGAGIYRPACGPAASRAATRSAPDAEGGSALLGHSQRPEVRYEFGQHDPPVHHLAQQPRLPLYDLLVSGGARRGPGWRLFFASIAWRPRTSRAVQFNFTGRQVALQAGRRPDPLDPRHAGQVVQGRPRCPLNIAVHRRHYSTVQGIGHNHSPLQQAGPACTRTESKPAYLHDDQSETQVDHRSAVIYPAGGNGSRAESALGSGRRVRWFRTGGDLA
jgi:hypothetical protein